MSKPNNLNLTPEYALVLQQVKEDGEENLTSLAEQLNFNRPRLLHILKSLQAKGLLFIRSSSYDEVWVQMTRKGNQVTTYIWPEASVYV